MSEYGIIELDEMVGKELISLNDVIEKMGHVTTKFNEGLRARATQLEPIGIAASNASSAAEKKRLKSKILPIFQQIAVDWNHYAEDMASELPTYRHHMGNAVNRFSRLAPMYADLGEQPVTELRESVDNMVSAMDGMVGSLTGLLAAVKKFPRMTTDIVRSKKRIEDVLEEIIEATRGFKLSFEAALRTMS